MMYGADADALRSLAALFNADAERLALMERRVSSRLGSTSWTGSDADSFRADWNRRHRPRLVMTIRQFTESACLVQAQAEQQRRASHADHASQASAPSIELNDTGDPYGSLSRAVLYAKIADDLKSIPQAWRQARLLKALNANREALGLGEVPAARWIHSVQHSGHSTIPWASTLLAVADVAVNWISKGPGDADTQGAVVTGALSTTAGAVAGPLGGVAFTAGTMIGTAITSIPVGGGRNLGEAMSSAAFDRAYGNAVPAVPERSAEWYRTATPAQIDAQLAAESAAVRAANQVVKRTRMPMFVTGWDVAWGSVSSLVPTART